MSNDNEPEYPCTLSVIYALHIINTQRLICRRTISIPLPTHHLASSAIRALSVDAELSPLVRRTFYLTAPETTDNTTLETATVEGSVVNPNAEASSPAVKDGTEAAERLTVLRTEYKATTNRMLRVAVNGFMESLGVVLGIMEELDIDVLDKVD